MVELNGDGQGSDNGSNLLVKFLGKLSQKSIFCLISIVKWDKMPEVKTRLQWQIIEVTRYICSSSTNITFFIIY